ncbi:MAG: right-handed parallel beta-helix repeat-containing protein [Candidatus Aenigmatarchaeota archaeon]
MLRLVTISLFVLVVMAVAANALETCSTCEACSAKLAINNAVVELSSDLSSSGDCITITGNDTTLDCGSHVLSGNGGSGIVVRSADVQISNCAVQNYSNAIKLENAIAVALQDCSLLHGQSYGDLLHIRGGLEQHYDHTFSGVTIEGKTLAYAFNQDGVEIGADDDGMVMVAYSDSAKIRNVNLSYGDGVRIHYSSGVTVENVIVTGGRSTGIESYLSPSGTYAGNQIQGSAKKGIYLVSSPGSTLSGNAFSDNTERSIEVSGSSCADYGNTIDVSNTVNGKPVNYYYGATGDVTGLDSGLLSIYCSSGMTVASSKANGGESIIGFNVTDSIFRDIETDKGLRLLESSGNNISYSTVGGDGITLEGSDNNTIFRNTVSSTTERGIYMVASDNNTVQSNNIKSAPEEGLVIHESRGNTLMWNNITDSGKGIVARCSQGNVVTWCNSSYNIIGMWMGDCANITVEGNTFQNNRNEGMKIEGAASTQSYIKIWHNNVFGNTQCCGGSRQISGEYDLQLYDLHQGNYWGRISIPAFIAGQESNRQGIVDAFPYWKPFGWLFIPVVTEMDITPATATTMDGIACRFFVSDQNNATLSVNVTWWKDGAVNSTTTVAVQNGTYAFSNHTAGTHYRNQKWSCSVQPFDGDDWGYMINSSEVSVINSKPTTPSLQLPQQSATLREQAVTFTYKSIDGDKDNLTYYFYMDSTIMNTTQESVIMNLTAGSHNGASRPSTAWKTLREARTGFSLWSLTAVLEAEATDKAVAAVEEAALR